MTTAIGQNTSTQGKEFWLSFMHNGFRDHTSGGWVTTQVLISAKRSCSGTVSNPLAGWTQSFTVSANNITTVNIPEAQGYHDSNNYEQISNKAIKVLANDTVSVYCTNIAHVSFDASFVLPVESLGDEYLIQSYDQSVAGSTNGYVTNNETSAFVIVATENNTQVNITPSVATLGGHAANSTFTVTLNAGQTYHVRSVRTGSARDLSGTHIYTAGQKKIAVFNGNTLTCIPITMGNGYDQVFEQAMPLRSWGKEFCVTSSSQRNRDFIKVTSSENNNVIRKNGNILTTLQANQSYTFDMQESERSCFIQANEPCAVYLYNNSSYDQNPSGGFGDPSMVWIAPVEQKIDEVTFTTFNDANINITFHCVNIIVSTSDVNNVYLDNALIPSSDFSPVNGNSQYSFARKTISHGVHHLHCSGGLNAHVYGFGSAKGYAYLVGSKTENLQPPLVTNDGPYCVGETIHLYANGHAGSTYSWTGPNNFSSTLQNPVIPNATMAMSGIYTCTIQWQDQTNSASTEINVGAQALCDFTYTTVCKGNPTQFTSTTTTNPPGQNITRYKWNFGDGQEGSGQSVTHTYAEAGNYQVTHIATTQGGFCTGTKTYTVPVYATPVPSIFANPPMVNYGGTSNLTCNAGAQGSFTFHWEPEDKVVSPNAQVTQTVPLFETTTFTCTVVNPQGDCTGTAQVTVSMEGSGMTALISADQDELCEGQSTQLHATPSGGSGNYTFSWTPANTLDNPNIANPIATPPVGSTTYTCHISDGVSAIDLNITLEVHSVGESDIFATICPDESYDFFGELITQPGTYNHIIETQLGCDSIIHLHLDHYETYETPITDRFCQGDTYNFYGTPINSPGYYYHTLEAMNGCDSVIKLNLIQNPSYDEHLYESTCANGIGYYFNGTYYTEEGNYVYNGQTAQGCDSIVTLHLTLTEFNTKTYNIAVCDRDYTWPSNGQTYTETGIYYDTLHYENACDSVLTLNLHIGTSDHIEMHVSACDTYHWVNTAYNVDMTFEQSTTYTHHYLNDQGCNSEVTLYLNIIDHDETELIIPEDESCDEYYWDPQGHEILDSNIDELTVTESGTYWRTYKNAADCDSIVTIHINMGYTPAPSDIFPMDHENPAPHWVITATEFQINSYDFNLWETEHPATCIWDTVEWSCDEAPRWVLEPLDSHGKRIRVYVLNRVEDTVWLRARVFNRCSGDEGVMQKYWLLCSFYGVEENDASTNATAFDFSVVPNPNNGQMTLHFENLTGKVDMKVYDMTGSLIDHFETYNDVAHNALTYNLKGRSEGIYYFVATAKEGIAAKKVVIK